MEKKYLDFEESAKLRLNLAKKLSQNTLHVEYVELKTALGRVLAKDIECKKNLPSFDNSAMDGFAFRHEDLGKKLKIIETIYAGDVPKPKLNANECYKIMTGAPVPSDADTIIPFEDCVFYDKDYATLNDTCKKGNALRLKGEELKNGEIILEAGTKINSRTISVLASQGLHVVPVYRALRIAVFSTGDELKEPWEIASEHQIYNINSSSLIALLGEYGFKAEYAPLVPDNYDDCVDYFANLCSYDAIITSGGISAGEADFIYDAMSANGLECLYHGLNIKPGRPTMIGNIKNTLIVALAGNPGAAYLNAFVQLIPMLRVMNGEKNPLHVEIEANNKQEFSVKPNRANIELGNYQNGEFIKLNKNGGSGMVMPLVNANAITITPKNTKIIKKNQKIQILLLT